MRVRSNYPHEHRQDDGSIVDREEGEVYELEGLALKFRLKDGIVSKAEEAPAPAATPAVSTTAE